MRFRTSRPKSSASAKLADAEMKCCSGCRPRYHAGKRLDASSDLPCLGGTKSIRRSTSPRSTRDHWLSGQNDRLPSLMADLVRRRVAVIATPGEWPAARRARPRRRHDAARGSAARAGGRSSQALSASRGHGRSSGRHWHGFRQGEDVGGVRQRGYSSITHFPSRCTSFPAASRRQRCVAHALERLARREDVARVAGSCCRRRSRSGHEVDITADIEGRTDMSRTSRDGRV
jgi:hypothetical protein